MNSLEIILWLLSIGVGGSSAYFICQASNWTFFWTGIPICLVSYPLFFGLWVVVLFIWGKFLKTDEPKKEFSRYYYHIIRITDATFLKLINVSFKRNGFSRMPDGHDYVLVCNHISNFDQMVLIAALKRKNQPMAWISKPENLKFPIAGPFVHHAGFIPINRENPLEGMRSIKQGVSYLTTHQCAMGICPEGTRNKTKEALLEFHAGSFKMAMWANVPIVVCCLRKTQDIKKRAPWRHTRVDVDIVDVIYPNEYKDKRASDISSRAHEAILEDLERNIEL